MSQFMQIHIRVIPFFEVPFEKRFPHLFEMLVGLNYQDVLKKEPSFYALVDTMVLIHDHPETPENTKARIRPYVHRLEKLKEAARAHLLARRLDDLDRSLYEIEDQFEDLERGL